MHPAPEIEHRLRDLMKTFLAENEHINLSALRTEDACWTGNILDSLSFADAVSSGLIPSPHRLIDVGTGGGFPLLPLAIAFPDCMCAGVDSVGKKIAAIGCIADAADIRNITLFAERSENLARMPEHREQYDTVTARAVAPLNILLEYAAPFARIGGHIVFWKSMHIDEELVQAEKSMSVLGCRLAHRHVYDLGGDWGERQLLLYAKESRTPREYPRAVGEAKAKPL